jgi:hypothetical protein
MRGPHGLLVLTEGTLTLETAALPSISATHLVVPGNDVGHGIRGQQLVVLSGGTLDDNFNVGPDSIVTLHSGGAIGRNLEAVGAELNIHGGTVGPALDALQERS